MLVGDTETPLKKSEKLAFPGAGGLFGDPDKYPNEKPSAATKRQIDQYTNNNNVGLHFYNNKNEFIPG